MNFRQNAGKFPIFFSAKVKNSWNFNHFFPTLHQPSWKPSHSPTTSCPIYGHLWGANLFSFIAIRAIKPYFLSKSSRWHVLNLHSCVVRARSVHFSSWKFCFRSALVWSTFPLNVHSYFSLSLCNWRPNWVEIEWTLSRADNFAQSYFNFLDKFFVCGQRLFYNRKNRFKSTFNCKAKAWNCIEHKHNTFAVRRNYKFYPKFLSRALCYLKNAQSWK